VLALDLVWKSQVLFELVKSWGLPFGAIRETVDAWFQNLKRVGPAVKLLWAQGSPLLSFVVRDLQPDEVVTGS